MDARANALLVAITLATGQAALGQGEPGSDPKGALPPKVLIAGVPFVAWGDAARLEYANKNILNPAVVATAMMEQKFWGLKPVKTRLWGPDGFEFAAWQNAPAATGKDLIGLKHAVAQGIPVSVGLTLTPHAHPESTAASMATLVCGDKAAGHSQSPAPASSGALGRFKSLETLRSLGVKCGATATSSDAAQRLEFAFLTDSMHAAPRLLIGYDDERRVMIVHDPSFGPALDIGYDDFETMWRYANRRYAVARPGGQVPASPADAAPYPPRSADMQAALQFVTGYALLESGRLAEAGQAFAQGLALPGVGPGYRFMLAFEAAHVALADRRIEDTVNALDAATDALPQACPAWAKLTELYRDHPSLPEASRRGEAAQARAARACGDRSDYAAFADAIPRDFYVQGLARLRGWGHDRPGR